jgi:hypothetical protein
MRRVDVTANSDVKSSMAWIPAQPRPPRTTSRLRYQTHSICVRAPRATVTDSATSVANTGRTNSIQWSRVL